MQNVINSDWLLIIDLFMVGYPIQKFPAQIRSWKITKVFVILLIAITHLNVGKISGQSNREFYNFLDLIWFMIGLTWTGWIIDTPVSDLMLISYIPPFFILLKIIYFPQ